MSEIKNNAEICEEHLETLRSTSEQWFYGYAFTRGDYIRFVTAMQYFENIKVKQRDKLIKEGEL